MRFLAVEEVMLKTLIHKDVLMHSLQVKNILKKYIQQQVFMWSFCSSC